MKSVYIFSTAGYLSHLAACILQGLTSAKKYKIYSNVSGKDVDSRGISLPIINSGEIEVVA